MMRHNRAIHLDFHTPKGVEDFGREFDAADFAKTLKNAEVSMITAVAQCNFGYSYYNTSLGVTYPTMKGYMFEDIVRECHKNDIGVFAYINVGINNVQAELHPEWCRVDATGKFYGTGDVRTGWNSTGMCYNTPYRRFLISVIEEILAKTDTDGIFCDCMGTRPCYCPTCLRLMRERGIDISDDDAVAAFAYDSREETAREIRKVIPDGKFVYQSGVPHDVAQPDGLSTHIEIESLPGGFGGWSHEHIGTLSSFARNLNPDIIYMSGKFHASWGDFGGIKEQASMENDLYDALIYNTGFAIGDHMNPATGLDKSLYKIIGNVFGKAKKYEKWTENAKYIAEIGVIKGKDSYSSSYSYHDGIFGITKMFTELGLAFDIVNEDMDFDKYRLLVISDFTEMTPKTKEKLSSFLRDGGALLSAGNGGLDKETGKFVLPQYDFVDYCGADSDAATCYRVTDSYYGDTTLRYSDYSEGILIKAKNEENIIAKRVSHYFDDRWDRHYFDCRWQAEHLYTYLPPSHDSGYDTAVMKGNICHIAFDIFSCYRRYSAVFQKKLVWAIINKLMPDPIIIKDNLPSTSKVSLTKTDKHTLLNVKVTYPEPRGKWFKVVEEHVCLPKGRKILIKGRYTKATIVSSMNEIETVFDGKYTHITLPEIEGFEMFVLEN